MYKIITCAENPELVLEANKRVYAEWPEFMLHDETSMRFSELFQNLPQFQFVLVDSKTDAVVSFANSVPLAYDTEIQKLPDKGWDWALIKGLDEAIAGVTPTILCAIQIVVFGENRGKGISQETLTAMKNNGKKFGLNSAVAPVRPNRKHEFPNESIDDYIKRFREDGLPFDPWLRVHARVGASIVKPCPLSMTIKGTVTEWESWTTMKFKKSGFHIVPGALSPVRISLEDDHGVYIEPNVWMYHPKE
ncbi:MAG: GNAT family N-acetyltransferase [Calditrichaeota bacterium]|nr:MAG: GNAT family N-acetyltransferase [Calditrichota bacterium]